MVYQPRPEKGTPLDSAIAEMNEIAAANPDKLSVIAHIQGLLERTRDELDTRILSKEEACETLFALYFSLQLDVQDVQPLAGILRVVGDDLGTQLGIDGDTLWDMYQRNL